MSAGPAVDGPPTRSESVVAEALPRAASGPGRYWLALILLGTLGVCAAQWNSQVGFEPIDCWVAQTSREMFESGDWRGYIIPKFAGETRMQKSPGPYWAVCLVTWLRGGSVDEFTVRLPNTLFTLLFVATAYWLTFHMAGRRAAIFAAAATATSGVVLYWSARGASDLGVSALMALSLAAFWIGAERASGARRGLLYLLGWLSAGLAMLYKMPMPLVCVAAPLGLYVLAARRWRLLLSWWHLAGLALFLLPWLPWALLTMQLEPTALHKWRVEYWDRATGDMPNVAEQKKWYWYLFYFGVALAFSAPYLVSIPGAIWRTMRDRVAIGREAAIFLLTWFFSLFAFFTLATGKETRYFLPAMPPLLIMLGIELAAFFDPARRATPRRDRVLARSIFISAPLAVLAGGAALYAANQLGLDDGETPVWELLREYAMVAGIFAAAACACGWLYRARREHVAFAALAGGTALTWLAADATLLASLGSQKPFRNFAWQLRTKLGPQEQAALRQVAQQDSRIIWYSDLRFPRVIDQLELLELQGGRRTRKRELELIGKAMIERLEGEGLALFVASPIDYLAFFIEAPVALARAGRTLPPAHVWIYADVGRWNQRFVLFGNRPPPWPEPRPQFPTELAERLESARKTAQELLTPARTEPGPGSAESHVAAGPPH